PSTNADSRSPRKPAAVPPCSLPLRCAGFVFRPVALRDLTRRDPDDGCMCGNIPVDNTACTGPRPFMHGHRRDEHGITADKCAVLDDGRILPVAIIIRRDRARADIDTLPDCR